MQKKCGDNCKNACRGEVNDECKEKCGDEI